MVSALLAGPIRKLWIRASLGIGPLALPQSQVRLLQHRRDEFYELLGRLLYRAYIAASHKRDRVLACCSHYNPP